MTTPIISKNNTLEQNVATYLFHILNEVWMPAERRIAMGLLLELHSWDELERELEKQRQEMRNILELRLHM